jgi:RNA polymerase primary sigma factor
MEGLAALFCQHRILNPLNLTRAKTVNINGSTIAMTFGGNAAGDVVSTGESENAYYRSVNEARALRLLRVALDYIPNPSFEDPACRAEILGPDPDLSVSGASHCAPATGGRFPEMAPYCAVPPLSPDQEAHLFRKMNYLKCCAVAIRRRINPARARKTTLDQLERLQEEAMRIKDQIVRSNLRLVVSIARRFAAPSQELSEAVSDGVVALLRAVDLFDFARGYKFSTFATCVVRNAFVSAARSSRRHDRFIAGSDGLADTADTRCDEGEEERAMQDRHQAVALMLGQLKGRERRIVIGRYGLGGAGKQTLAQLGNELGISKERVRQIELRATTKLRRFARTAKNRWERECPRS